MTSASMQRYAVAVDAQGCDMIEFRTLGALNLRDADGGDLRAIFSAPKRTALLSYLALASPGGFHRRDTLVTLFWPELDQAHARGALRQTLHAIRHSVTDGTMLRAGDEQIGLDEHGFWCDTVAFEALLEEGRLEEALQLYRGDLLEGFHLSGCLEFERWLETERDRLKRRAANAAWTLAERNETGGDASQAAHWARRALALSSDDEGRLRQVVALLDRLGDRSGAIAEYERFATRLHEDYEAEPAPETQQVIAGVRGRTDANGSAISTAAFSARVDPLVAPGAVAATVPVHDAASRRATRGARRPLVAIGIVVVVLLGVGTAWMTTRGSTAVALDPTKVLVDIFQNETGDPSLDHLGLLATDRVTAGLTYTGFVDVVSLGAPLLSREPVEIETEPGDREARLLSLGSVNRTGTAVWGSYYLHDDSISFLAHVTNIETGEELAALEPMRGTAADAVALVERLRDQVMATLATVADPRLVNWARYASKPPTFDAYLEFVEGIDLHTRQMLWSKSFPHFLAAATIDTNFTMPLIWTLWTYAPRATLDSIIDVLRARREHMAPLDRHLFDYHMAYREGDLQEALDAIRRVVEIAPSSGYLFNAGQIAYGANRPREAVEFFEQADPERGWLQGWFQYWDYYTRSYHMLGDYEGELRAAERGRRQFPERRRWEIRALASLGRVPEMMMLIEEVDGLASQGSSLLSRWDAINALRVHGHDEAAVTLLNVTLARFDSLGVIDTLQGTTERGMVGSMLAMGHRLDEARTILEDVVQGEPGGWQALTLAAAIVQQGDPAAALQMFGLARTGDDGPTIRAAVAAQSGDLDGAVRFLRRSRYAPYAIHRAFAFEPLRGYPPFEEWLRPKG